VVASLALSWIGFTALVSAQEAPPLPEGNAYVQGVLNGPRSQDDAINDFSYDLEETKENLDKNGVATSRETLAYQVYFVETRPVRRLVARNGRPLSPKEQREVDRKAAAKARAISLGQTVSEQAGIRLSSLVGSFDFQTVSREEREGRSTLIFDFEPRKNAAPRSSSNRTTDAVARILTGRVQIDEADRRVVRLDAWNEPGEKASVSTGVKLGTFRLSMEFTPVEGRVWLPRLVVRLVAGRAFFFKTFRIRHTTIYSNYRRFKVETEERVIP